MAVENLMFTVIILLVPLACLCPSSVLSVPISVSGANSLTRYILATIIKVLPFDAVQNKEAWRQLYVEDPLDNSNSSSINNNGLRDVHEDKANRTFHLTNCTSLKLCAGGGADHSFDCNNTINCSHTCAQIALAANCSSGKPSSKGPDSRCISSTTPLTPQCSWMSGWLRWCPTSTDLLRQAEKKILVHLKTVGPGKYVDIGCIPEGVTESSLVWTLRANIESPNTPLVLVHGFGSGSALWCLNIDALAANRPVYAIDILGFGRSSRPTFDTDAMNAEKQFISSIEGWRQAIGLEKFILMGHSFGGFLSASYAIKYPNRVAHLVLADPWGFPERPLDVNERYNLPMWAKALGSVAQIFNPLAVLRASGPLGPSILQKARPDLTRKFSDLLPDAAEAIPNYLYHCNAQEPSGETGFHSLMSGFGWAKYPMIHRMESLQQEVPITLIYGSRSWVDRDPGFHIKYSRPNSFVDVQILQGAGHHVYADRSHRFNDLVNIIGQHVDAGTLPSLAPTSEAERQAATSPANKNMSITETLTKFINVRHDTNRANENDESGGLEEETDRADTQQKL